jgi:hypothetical protein
MKDMLKNKMKLEPKQIGALYQIGFIFILAHVIGIMKEELTRPYTQEEIDEFNNISDNAKK